MLKYDIFNFNPYDPHMKIVKYVGEGKKILDIGCSTGQVARRLVENGCEVIGVELDERSAKIASNYCKNVIMGDAEEIRDLPYPDKYFDIMIFADVLEHLKSPGETLKKFNKYLNDNGFIIVSVPNIAYWLMRLKLLFGNFDYEDEGILDSTHLKFFNKKNAERLLADNGFEITKFDIAPSKVPYFPKKLSYLISKKRPNLFAYEFLMIGRKKFDID